MTEVGKVRELPPPPEEARLRTEEGGILENNTLCTQPNALQGSAVCAGTDLRGVLRQIADLINPLLAEADEAVHFEACAYTARQLAVVLQVLKDEKQIQEETSLDDFLYYCSYTDGRKAPSAKLRWVGQRGVLAAFISDAFDSERNRFKTACSVFESDKPLRSDNLRTLFSTGVGEDKYEKIRNIFTKLIKNGLD